MYNRTLALLLFFQSFSACQQAQESLLASEDGVSLLTNTSSQQCQAITPAVASNLVFQSVDGGKTWQDVSAGLSGDNSVECFLSQNGEVFLGVEKGFYHSQSTATAPVWEKDLMLGQHITSVFPGRAGLYALSIQNVFFQNIAKGVWVRAFNSLNNQYFRSLLETPDGTLFVGCDNGIFKSADQGKTWKHVFEEGMVISMVEASGVLLAGGQKGILRSADGGEHWDWVLSEGGMGISTERIEGGFAAITYNTESETRRIRISMDGGKTWKPIDAGLPPDASIASIKQVGEYLFCGHPAGIYRSSDLGKTWQLVLPSIGKKVFNLSISGKVIYAMPRDGGC